MIGSVQAWFVVEVTSMTHAFGVQGGRMPFFSQTEERIHNRRAMHRLTG